MKNAGIFVMREAAYNWNRNVRDDIPSGYLEIIMGVGGSWTNMAAQSSHHLGIIALGT